MKKAPKTVLCAKETKKEPETSRFPAFSGRGDRIGFSGPRRPFGQRGSDVPLARHSLPLIQILFSFDEILKTKKALDLSRALWSR